MDTMKRLSQAALLLGLWTMLSGFTGGGCGGTPTIVDPPLPVPPVADRCQGLDEKSCLGTQGCGADYVETKTCPACDCVDCACAPCQVSKTFVGCHEVAAPKCKGLDETTCRATPACEPVYGVKPGADLNGCMPPPSDYLGCEQKQCAPLGCRMDCPNGLAVDENGCNICACKDPLPCTADEQCPAGQLCAIPELVCPPGAKCPQPAGVCTPRPDACPKVMCDLACPGGHMKRDANGCETCQCEMTCTSDAQCGPGYRCALDSPTCPPGADCAQVQAGTCVEVVCPMLACAQLNCPYGPKVDQYGCYQCACNEPPCKTDADCAKGESCVRESAPCPTNVQCDPPEYGTCQQTPVACPELMCAMYCQWGNVLDANGCVTCQCNPTPPSNTCTADADCASGETCQPDPTDPCNSPTTRCLMPGRMVCVPKCAGLDEKSCLARADCSAVYASSACVGGGCTPTTVFDSCQAN